MAKQKHGKAWLNAPWDAVVGTRSWHEKLCHTINEIIILANRKRLLNQTNWTPDNLTLSVSSTPDDAHWRVDFADYHYRSNAPLKLLEALLEEVKGA
jgi:hypothetical protein